MRCVAGALMLWAVLPACFETPDDLAPARLMAIGDSLLAGVQTWSLNETTQADSVPALVSQAMVDDGVLFAPATQPLLRNDGNRMDRHVVADNVAVPGSTLRDALREEAGRLPITLADLLLYPSIGSQLDLVLERRPAFLLVWIGNNDVLDSVTSRGEYDASQLTPIADFERRLIELLDALHTLLAYIMIATLPDVTDAPVLVDAKPYGGAQGARIHLLDAVDIAEGARTPQAVVDDPARVLTVSELVGIRAHLEALNAIIVAEAKTRGIALVDIHALLHDANATGLGFGLGAGVFSLDGIHPSPTAYGLIANAFLDALNTHHHFSVPLIDVDAIAPRDPYVDRDGDGHVEGPRHTVHHHDWERVAAWIGLDCSPLDPAVHPDANDSLGDGIDANCDGVDGVQP